MTKTIKTKTKIEKLITERQNKTDLINADISNAENALADAEAQMNAAADDPAAYAKAQQGRNNAEMDLEMFRRRLDNLERDPIITDDQYDDFCVDVKSDVREAREEALAQMFNLVSQIETIAADYSKLIQQGDDALHTLQYDMAANGLTEPGQPNHHKSIQRIPNEYYDVIQWADLATGSTAYKAMKAISGRKEA